MKPVIYAEEYIEQMDGQVYDYKFLCYDGEPKMVLVIGDRFQKGKTKKTFFDTNWNVLPFTRGGPSIQKIERPKHLDKMIEFSKKLSKPFPFVRCDFYEIGDQVLLGEMTFYPGGGLLEFKPAKHDLEMGKFIQLPEKWL